ncbi:MAG: deoxyribose-phosphate aldolase [Planctomycetes bacterium GWF2_50_10]|nr:MAG: deoxyribose-phosphate aldolase [Planctomycetes bacterium GWF2_50_10]
MTIGLVKDIARMLDISAVQADSTESDIRNMAALAKKYDCVACFAMPAYTRLLKELLCYAPNVNVGGVIGFPSGANTIESKVQQTHQLLDLGCNELDMVINIGRLKSADFAYVFNDVYSVVNVAGNICVKLILECHYLTNDEIKTACELAVKAGIGFVKTGTGWAPTGATPGNVELMKRCVGERAQVKAAGGVRDLATLLNLHRLGATRFGVSAKSAKLILEEMELKANG